MLQKFFQRYTGILRSLKATYVLNNLLNAARLQQHRALYRQFGVRKSIFSPIGAADFPRVHAPADLPWLDRPAAAAAMEQHPAFLQLPADLQAKARQFEKEGFTILENFIPQPETERLNQTVDDLLASGKAGFNFTGRKIFNLWELDDFARERFFQRPELTAFLSFLLGRKVVPFQSLNFTQGSEQKAHSDAIHMTTEPPGFLIAAWMALEDVDEESGPLIYYPGSHRLPFVSTRDYPSGNSRFMLGRDSNRQYERKIAEVIDTHQLEGRLFLPKRGDVLIWHSNLLHGGAPIRRLGATRRSMVCHYFAEGVICYHEMSQRPALRPR